MSIQIFEITPEQAGERLDKILAAQFPGLSRVQVQKLIKEGQVEINGIPGKPSLRLSEQDHLTIQLPEAEPESQIIPQAIPLDIIYEDEYLVAINKPAGLVMHPSLGHEQGTVVNALLARYPQLYDFSDLKRAGIVHRLDKDTSGVVLAALTEDVQTKMMEQFHARVVKKVYWALVERHPKTERGHIDAPIKRDPRQYGRRAVIYSGKPAITDYHTLERFENHTLLEVYPHTGRTHQIRVHMVYIGCPIVGDRVYGFRQQTLNLERQFLHAKAITFNHPVTGQEMTFVAELPDDLEHVLQQLRHQES